MALPRVFPAAEGADLRDRPLHLAIGMFDGVHLGHQAVIEAAVRAAHCGGGRAAVMTFRPHPSRLFRPDQPTRLILDDGGQAERLGELGVDAVIHQPFTRAYAAIAAEKFLPWLKGCLPALAAVYVGENWRFGAGRRGDIPCLVESARPLGVSVYSAPPVNWDGEPVTSTRVRALLEAGDMAQANALLGRPYSATGRVAPGRRLGRTLGFPTLNVPWDPELRPRFGVYRVLASAAEGGPVWKGVANYGVRPTVENDGRPVLEVHLLDPKAGETLPKEGDAIRVDWLGFVRPEMKFGSIDELRTQIARDVAAARG